MCSRGNNDQRVLMKGLEPTFHQFQPANEECIFNELEIKNIPQVLTGDRFSYKRCVEPVEH